MRTDEMLEDQKALSAKLYDSVTIALSDLSLTQSNAAHLLRAVGGHLEMIAATKLSIEQNSTDAEKDLQIVDGLEIRARYLFGRLKEHIERMQVRN